MASRPTVAIVTTLRDADPVLDSFITYHLAIGFDLLFLFFDNPADRAIETALKYPQVRAIRNDHSLRRKWKRTTVYRESDILRQHIDSEVMARQELNVEIAIRMALEEGIDWLLHIDIDELFCAPSQTVGEHFKSLSDSGVRHVTYVNYEAIPERVDMEDYFTEVTLFKKSPQIMKRGSLSRAQLKLVNSTNELPESFFFFYSNGKSAGRVSDALLPLGVHVFRAAESIGEAQLVTSPFILHYACCGFEHFWRKYKRLGNFPDKWFSSLDIAETGSTFHLEARDAVQGNDRRKALEFYKKRVVISEAETIVSLLKSGLCCRVYEPSKLIEMKTGA